MKISIRECSRPPPLDLREFSEIQKSAYAGNSLDQATSVKMVCDVLDEQFELSSGDRRALLNNYAEHDWPGARQFICESARLRHNFCTEHLEQGHWNNEKRIDMLVERFEWGWSEAREALKKVLGEGALQIGMNPLPPHVRTALESSL